MRAGPIGITHRLPSRRRRWQPRQRPRPRPRARERAGRRRPCACGDDGRRGQPSWALPARARAPALQQARARRQARRFLGSKTSATLGKGLLLCGRCRLGGILVRIGIVVGRSSLLGLDRGRRGLAHRIDYLGLNNGRHLFLRLAELTDGTADRAAHLWELIRAKQQKAEDHDDRELTLSNTKHTYLQGSM